MHPLKYLVASSGISNDPTIHIWNVINCEVIRVLKTHHKNGILKLEFSRDSSLLVSIAFDRFYSI
jgi:WD40 repeat protein